MSRFVFRAMGAAALDPSAFEEVETDSRATAQAFGVVLLSSVAAGVGAAGTDAPTPAAIAGFSTVALATWLAWAALILHFGGRLSPEAATKVDFGQLVRTIGFSAGPGVLQVMAAMTTIRWYAFGIAWAWMLAAMIVAVRQALDYESLWHAVRVCVITLAVVLMTAVVFAIGVGTIVQ